MVTPAKLREVMKQKVHPSHMGTERYLRPVRECLFWPDMSAEMKQLVESCETCRKYDTAQPKETLKSTEMPKRTWERIAIDLLYYKGKEILITLDYFWELDRLANSTATTVITITKTGTLDLSKL